MEPAPAAYKDLGNGAFVRINIMITTIVGINLSLSMGPEVLGVNKLGLQMG